eukprot:scaffold2619_cov123-Isochrysis_galbana.AAC.3
MMVCGALGRLWRRFVFSPRPHQSDGSISSYGTDISASVLTSVLMRHPCQPVCAGPDQGLPQAQALARAPGTIY